MAEKEKSYLSIDANGRIYTRTDENNELATKVILKDGTPTYREYRKYGSIDGKITRMNIGEVTFDGRTLKRLFIHIENDTNIDVFSLNVWSQGGSMDGYTQSIAMICPMLDKDTNYTIRPAVKPNAKGRVPRNLYVTNSDTREWLKLPDEKYKELPEAIVKVRADGVKTYDFGERNDVLYKQLEAFIQENYPYTGEFSSEPVSEKLPDIDLSEGKAAKPKTTKQPVAEPDPVVDVTDEELPF